MGPRWPLVLVGLATSGCASTPDPCADRVPGTACAVAGTGELAFNHDGLPASQTAFYLPSEARRGPDGLVYIADFNNQRIRRIDANGTISTVAGNGFHAGADVNVRATDSALAEPIALDFLPDGRLIFIAYHDPRVFAIDPDQTLRLIAGGDLGVIGNEGDGQDPLAARFISLAGIAVGPDGAIYLADDMANRVRVIRDGTIETLVGTGRPLHAGDGGPATAADLLAPTALALDPSGALLVAESGSSAIRKIALDGTISTIAGTGVTGDSGDGGLATAAQLGDPEGLAVAADGTLFIGERKNARIRRVATDGTISTIAGTGTRGMTGDHGPAVVAQFGNVARIHIDTDGSLLIADQSNSCIRTIITPD